MCPEHRHSDHCPAFAPVHLAIQDCYKVHRGTATFTITSAMIIEGIQVLSYIKPFCAIPHFAQTIRTIPTSLYLPNSIFRLMRSSILGPHVQCNRAKWSIAFKIPMLLAHNNPTSMSLPSQTLTYNFIISPVRDGHFYVVDLTIVPSSTNSRPESLPHLKTNQNDPYEPGN